MVLCAAQAAPPGTMVPVTEARGSEAGSVCWPGVRSESTPFPFQAAPVWTMNSMVILRWRIKESTSIAHNLYYYYYFFFLVTKTKSPCVYSPLVSNL